MTPTEFHTFRRSRLLTQSRIAARLGVTERTVRRWESGATPIPHRVKLAMRTIRPRKGTTA